MPFQIVILWTDWLIFLLVAVIAVTVVYVRGREHLLAPRLIASRKCRSTRGSSAFA